MNPDFGIPDEPNKDESYDDWRLLGYQVKRGEKSQIVNGRRVFSKEQVEERDDFDRANGIRREEDSNG